MRGKSSLGNHFAASHSAACGCSSASTKRRIEARSSSCSSPNGGGVRGALATGTPFEKSRLIAAS